MSGLSGCRCVLMWLIRLAVTYNTCSMHIVLQVYFRKSRIIYVGQYDICKRRVDNKHFQISDFLCLKQ